MCVCMHVCMYVCMCIYIYIYIHIYTAPPARRHGQGRVAALVRPVLVGPRLQEQAHRLQMPAPGREEERRDAEGLPQLGLCFFSSIVFFLFVYVQVYFVVHRYVSCAMLFYCLFPQPGLRFAAVVGPHRQS